MHSGNSADVASTSNTPVHLSPTRRKVTAFTFCFAWRTRCLRKISAGLVLCVCSFWCSALSAQDAELSQILHDGNREMREGHPEQAIERFRAAVALSPRFAEGFFNLGLAYGQAGQQSAAVYAFTQALKLKPSLPGAHLFLGIANYRLNRLDAAVEALKRETVQAPSSAKAWMWLGIAYLAQNKAEPAVTALDRAATLDPKDLDVMYHRGRAHQLVSKSSYEQMFKASPTFWRVHQVLAEAYAGAERHAEAITEYKVAIEAAPSEPGLHDRLGEELWKDNLLDEADQAYAEELKIDPNSVTAMYRLGRLRVTRTQPDQVASGVSLLDAVLAQEPAMAEVEYYLGRGMVQLARNEEALAHFQKAIQLEPESDMAQLSYYQLSRVYRQMRRPDESKVALLHFQQLKAKADADQKKSYDRRLKPNLETADRADIPSAAP